MTKLIIATTISGLALFGLSGNYINETPEKTNVRSFVTSKRILETKIYNSYESRKSFYCGCKYNPSKEVNKRSCGFQAANQTLRSNRIEWEHIVPASILSQGLACRKNGRTACRKNSIKFKKMEGDLHNLVPAIGEINLKRSNYKFGLILGESRMFGKCDFEVKSNIVEPKENIRGNIARIWLYMSKKYNLSIDDRYRHTLSRWNTRDPVDSEEIRKNNLIERIQGDSNPYIKR